MKKDAKNTIWQFLKFSVVGVTNTVVGFVVFYLLTRRGVNYIIAQVISYTAGILNSYIWNSFWTFRKEIGRASCRERV